MLDNNRGQMIMINMLLFLMTLVVLVALIPAFKDILGLAQQSDGLNCNGYKVGGDANNKLSYNSSLATDTVACLAIRLYLPYIILTVLIGGVAFLLGGRLLGGGGGAAPTAYG